MNFWKFWKKYKQKKELRNKLKKARFINFYEYSIDLEDGKPISIQRYNETHIYDLEILNKKYLEKSITKAFIFLYYSNKNKGRFKKKWCYGENEAIRDFRNDQLLEIMNSAEFTECLNQYRNFKKEYEQF